MQQTTSLVAGRTDTATAQRIADSINMEDRETEPCDLAAAAEAHLSLGNHNEALAYTIEYVHRSDADAAALADLLGRLVEIWDLTELSPPGRRIIPFLQAELLQRDGGRVDVRGESTAKGLRRLLRDKLYEAVLGDQSFEHVRFFARGLRRLESIGAVHDVAERRFGPCVVVNPADFDLDSTTGLVDGERLLLTSAHAIGHDGALPIGDVRVSLERSRTSDPLMIAEVVKQSPVDDLNYALVRTEPPLTEPSPIPIAKRPPAAGSRVVIVDCSSGGPGQASLFTNEVIASESPFLNFRSAPAPEHSGCPIMNDKWQLIGLEQSADSVRIDAIAEAEIDLRNTETVT